MHTHYMTPRPSQRRFLSASPFNRIEPVHEIEQFAVADRVTHDRYGLGRVITAGDATVVVDFGPQRVRICSPFHKLSKL